MEELFMIVGAITCYVFGIALATAVLGTFIVGLIEIFSKKR